MNDVRQLTSREQATVRAALRLWLETPADRIPDRCYEEVASADDIEGDDAIERLLAELSLTDAVTVRVPCDLAVATRVIPLDFPMPSGHQVSARENGELPPCPCGKPWQLDKFNPSTRALVEQLIRDNGEFLLVSVANRSFLVSRRCIAFHGITGQQLLFDPHGFQEVEGPPRESQSR